MDHGIRANRAQFALQLLQVFLVGMTLGTLRTVVPALAEDEFGVPRGSFLLLAAFVLAFGLVKAAMNLVAGHWADRAGRRRVLLARWLVALPIPPLLHLAPSWNWVVAATVLLGVQQGLAWSATQVAKLDLTRADQRGLVLGLDEFAGYGGMALAGLASAWVAQRWGARDALLWLGLAVVAAALLALAWTRETRPWAHAARDAGGGEALTARAVFARMSWGDRRLAALCQAGLVEKFVDALVWVFWPVYLHARGLALPVIGAVVGAYGFTWGVAQLVTGRLSDRVGRMVLNVGGMWLCAVGVLLFPQAATVTGWTLAAALTGLGMAMLYPTLGAAVADLAAPAWRATALGVYRFWRDLGYAVGALVLGVVAMRSGALEPAFTVVGVAMLASGAWLWLAGRGGAPTR